MQGFEVVSINDEKCIGHVVERSGDYLIVEHGHLRHSKNALPLSFAEVDEANERVTTTLSASMVHESPKVNGDGVDVGAVAAYYGIGGADVESTEAERIAVREELAAREGPQDTAPDSPALLGDRTS
jgi:hypothetical protein